MTARPLLSVDGLRVEIVNDGRAATVVDDVSFSLGEGEFVGLAGESGSGKSMTALSILGLLPPFARASGRILLDGEDLLRAPPRRIRQVRGKDVSMVFQEPLTSLHPALTIGFQIEEAIRAHEPLTGRQAAARAIELLGRVGIPEPQLRARQYPSEFSGGMLQRAMVAMALACRPRLLIADEPTTALDVTVQAQLMDLLGSLHDEFGMAVLLISHDLGLVAGRTERLLVMYAGQVIEAGPTANVFARPASPYTEALLGSIPNPDRKRERLRTIPGTVPSRPGEIFGCRFANRCSYRLDICVAGPVPLTHAAEGRAVRCIRAGELLLENRWTAPGVSPASPALPARAPLLKVAGLTKVFRVAQPGGVFLRHRDLVAVDDVSLEIGAGETFGIVGESGSGKSTLARLILRLLRPTSGTVQFEGADLARLGDRDMRAVRTRMQAMFQNVTSGLNPRMNLAGIVGEPLAEHRQIRGDANRRRAAELLEMVGLGPSYLERYPYELSGGQRQRVGLARAMASEPRLIVLDEPASSLDVSTQSQVVNLLNDLQERTGVSYLLIAHDLHLVHHVCHRIAVMYLGRIVEIGEADEVLKAPRHPYTQALVRSIPKPVPGGSFFGAELAGEIPSPTDIPSGCRFRTRCPFVWELCARVDPRLTAAGEGSSVACHLYTEAGFGRMGMAAGASHPQASM